MMEAKVLVFDFDGVIVRHSEFFKEQVWREVFAPYQSRYEAHLKKAREELFGFGKKGDRFDILRYVYTQIGVPKEEISSLVVAGAELFNTRVQAEILLAGVASGDEEALTSLQTRYPLFVNSSTTEAALRESLRALKIEGLFIGSYGGPASKVENFSAIALATKVRPADILFVGDSDGDAAAARDYGCLFVGVANEWNGWRLGEKTFPLIKGISDLVQFLGD